MSAKTLLYVDSSSLVGLALADPKRAPFIRESLEKADEVLVSELAMVECEAGLQSPVHRLSPAELAVAEQNLNRLLGQATVISVSSTVLGVARTLVRQYRRSHGLRSADAIHLATAKVLKLSAPRETRMTFLTSDQKQFEAFSAEGWVGDLV